MAHPHYSTSRCKAPAPDAAAASLGNSPSSGRAGCVKLQSRKGWLALPSQMASYLDSDTGHEYLQVGKLFVLAYSPCAVSFLVLGMAFAGAAYRQQLLELCRSSEIRSYNLTALLALVCACSLSYTRWRGRSCYLVDFASFKPPDEHKLSTEHCVQFIIACKKFTCKDALFQLKVLLRSGLGEETYAPAFVFSSDRNPTLPAARGETDLMMGGALDELLFKTSLDPKHVDVLIVCVGLFYPSPSLSSHLVNRYKMREDVKTFNIAGMGCASAMIAVDLAKDLLKVHTDRYVVIVGTENMTLNVYNGSDRSMLVTNCLFRCGSHALLLSNLRKDKHRSKFELVQSARTTTAAQDESFNAIVTKEDDEGYVGSSLSMKLLAIAAQALSSSTAKLIPYSMPITELLKVGANAVQRHLLRMKAKPYLPDFRKAFTHFCIHPGGKAVIDGIGKKLRLSDYDLEPARMALHRFGNTSNSGLWYVMAYWEAKEKLRRGDKVCQVALGAGLKCNIVVWRVLQDVKPRLHCNPWLECIHAYPVQISDTISPAHPYYYMVEALEEKVKRGEEEEPVNV